MQLCIICVQLHSVYNLTKEIKQITKVAEYYKKNSGFHDNPWCIIDLFDNKTTGILFQG